MASVEVPKELVDKVYEVIEVAKTSGKIRKGTNEKFPLKGFLLCPVCNKPLRGSTPRGNGGYNSYYHCDPKKKCSCNWFKRDLVHDQVEKLLLFSKKWNLNSWLKCAITSVQTSIKY